MGGSGWRRRRSDTRPSAAGGSAAMLVLNEDFSVGRRILLQIFGLERGLEGARLASSPGGRPPRRRARAATDAVCGGGHTGANDRPRRRRCRRRRRCDRDGYDADSDRGGGGGPTCAASMPKAPGSAVSWLRARRACRAIGVQSEAPAQVFGDFFGGHNFHVRFE